MAPEEGRRGSSLLVQHIPNTPPTSNVGVTQVQSDVQNRNALNTIYEFKRGSPLKQFLFDQTKVEKNIYSLAEILTILKETISNQKMFDERNPSVIMCSKPLEKALNQKALHVTEVREQVLVQLERLEDQSQRARAGTRPAVPRPAIQSRGPVQSPAPSVARMASVATSVQTSNDAKFRLKPLFQHVVRSVEGCSQSQTIFTYEEVTLYLSKYILSKKDTLFDPRNIKLALVRDDPLGYAFGVEAFHRCQVNSLLRQQLLPVNPNTPSEVVTTTSTSSPGLSISVQDRPVAVISAKDAPTSSSSSLPAFPALTKAASTPASLLAARKRSNSTDKSEDDSKAKKQNRRSGQCSVIIRRSADSDVESDTETIYSEQGYETIKAAEEEEAATDSCSDMDTTREGFDVEYDIDSGEEEERPPQAHGQGQDFSSADDTDTDLDERHRAITAVADVKESIYWADSEEEKGDTEEAQLRGANKKVWKCISCQTPNKPMIQYCARCWEARKTWVPERPRRKGRKKAERAAEAKLVLGSGQDDTDGGCPEVDRPRTDTMSSQDSGIGSQDLESLELGETEFAMDTTPVLRSLSLDVTSSSSGTSGLELGDLSELSSISSVGSAGDLRRTAPAQDLCMFCTIRPKNASFIHGRLGHQVCCYPCAKKHWKTCPTCPVCKRTVEKIVKVIQA